MEAEQIKKMTIKAEQIVSKILADLTDCKALRQAWDDIDEDIQQEIRDTWADIVRRELSSLSAIREEP